MLDKRQGRGPNLVEGNRLGCSGVGGNHHKSHNTLIDAPTKNPDAKPNSWAVIGRPLWVVA